LINSFNLKFTFTFVLLIKATCVLSVQWFSLNYYNVEERTWK